MVPNRSLLLVSLTVLFVAVQCLPDDFDYENMIYIPVPPDRGPSEAPYYDNHAFVPLTPTSNPPTLWDRILNRTTTPPSPKNRNKDQPKLTGKITIEMCYQKKYRNLRSCIWALNSKVMRQQTSYTKTFLRKDKIAKRTKETMQYSFRGTGFTRNAPSLQQNPCSSFELPHPVQIIEAEDMNGNTVELYQDIGQQIFQTFYRRDCYHTSMFPHLTCAEVKIAVDTAIWVDDGDGNPLNDVVEVRKVRIPMDCALHQSLSWSGFSK